MGTSVVPSRCTLVNTVCIDTPSFASHVRMQPRKPKRRLANVETPTPTRYGKALKRMTSVFIAQEFLDKFVKVQTCTEGMTGQG